MSIEDKAVEIISQLQALGPQITDLALQTARVGALGTIVWGAVFSTAAIFAWRVIARRVWPWALQREGLDFSARVDREIGGGFALAFSIFGATLLTVGALINITNLYAWIGIWHPEIYLASKVIS